MCGAGVGELSCDGRSAASNPEALRTRRRAAFSPMTRFALPSKGAAAACRSRQRPPARFRRAAPATAAGFASRRGRGLPARAAASSRRAAVRAGSDRRATARLPASPVGFRAAAARPLQLDQAPAAMRRGPPCHAGRQPECGAITALRHLVRLSASTSASADHAALAALNGAHHSTASRARHGPRA